MTHEGSVNDTRASTRPRKMSNISFKNFYVFSCQIYQIMVNSKYKLKQEM